MSVEEKETIMAYETVTLQTLLREIAGRTSSNQDADAIRMAADALDAFAADVGRDEAVRAAEDAAAVPSIQHRDLPEQVALLWASVGDLIARVVRLEGEMDAGQDEEADAASDEAVAHGATLNALGEARESLAAANRGIARLTAERDAAIRERDAARAERDAARAESERLRAAGDAMAEALTWDQSCAYDAATTRGAIRQRIKAWSEASARVAELEAAPPPRGWLTAKERAAVEEAMVDYASNVGDHDCERIERVLRALLARETPPRVKAPSKAFIILDNAWIAAIRDAGGEVE